MSSVHDAERAHLWLRNAAGGADGVSAIGLKAASTLGFRHFHAGATRGFVDRAYYVGISQESLTSPTRMPVIVAEVNAVIEEQFVYGCPAPERYLVLQRHLFQRPCVTRSLRAPESTGRESGRNAATQYWRAFPACSLAFGMLFLKRFVDPDFHRKRIGGMAGSGPGFFKEQCGLPQFEIGPNKSSRLRASSTRSSQTSISADEAPAIRALISAGMELNRLESKRCKASASP